MSKKRDIAAEIMERIMSEPIPTRGQLNNPLIKEKVTKRKGQIRLSDIPLTEDRNVGGYPDDVRVWTDRQFVDYFADHYQAEIGGNYRRIYRVDCQIIQKIIHFFTLNGLEGKEWAKKFLDWAFLHQKSIIRREGHFTLNDILRVINHFYQEEVIPQVEEGVIQQDTTDVSMLEELIEADKNGKAAEIYTRFGIPIAVTFYVNIRGFKFDTVMKGTEQRLSMLAQGGVTERQQLGQILHSSIINSAYPDKFLLLDWRNKFEAQAELFYSETWWRDADYRTKVQDKYLALLLPS